jgi:DNA repair protein RadC
VKYDTTASIYGIMVRDADGSGRLVPVTPLTGRTVHEPVDAYAEILSRWPAEINDPREKFFVIGLDSRRRVILAEIISVGTCNQTLVHPREVFRPLVASGAHTCVVAHNHPSGDAEPSPEDIAVTRRLDKAAKLLDIALLDHLVITSRGSFVSLQERQRSGLLPVEVFGC